MQKSLRRLPECQSAALIDRYTDREAWDVLHSAITEDFSGRIALVSSFGAESVVLLHMVAKIDPETPVLFGETEMLFPETLVYQRQLADVLGLKNIQHVRPLAADVAAHDPDGMLNATDPDACCALRKVRPLERAIRPYAAWITGRKRQQSKTRAMMPFAECDAENRVKLNPLADWTADEVRAYMKQHDLPAHPLVAKGFHSIGCAPCTSAVRDGEDPRAGRWRGKEKTECGIHFVNGKPVRAVH